MFLNEEVDILISSVRVDVEQSWATANAAWKVKV